MSPYRTVCRGHQVPSEAKRHQRAATVAQNVSEDQVRCCTRKQQMLPLTLPATLSKLDGGASGA